MVRPHNTPRKGNGMAEQSDLSKLDDVKLAEKRDFHKSEMARYDGEISARAKVKSRAVLDQIKTMAKAAGLSTEELAKALKINVSATPTTGEGEGTSASTAPKERKEIAKPYGVAGMVYPETQAQKAKRGQPVTYAGRGTLPSPLGDWMKSKEGKAWRDDTKNTTMFPVAEGHTMKGEDNRWNPATRKTAWDKLLATAEKAGRPAGT